jgi:hypothetical protein
MARIGYLYLRQGEWNGDEVVPPKYVRASTGSRTTVGVSSSLRYRIWRITAAALGRDRSLDLRLGYGYQWFVLPSGGFAARGYGGQAIFVFPEKDLVVVMTGGLPPRDTFLPEWLIERYLLPAVGSDSALVEEWAEELPPAPAGATPMAPGPSAAEARIRPNRPVLKRRYRMLPNAAGVKGSELDLPEAGAGFLVVEQGEQTTRVEIGLDGEYRYTELPDGTLTAVRGGWQDEKTFRMESHSLPTGDRYDWTFTFEGETVIAESRGTIGQSVARVRGRVADNSR